MRWLRDASLAEIPNAVASGTINGSLFSFKYGRLQHSGAANFGSSNLSFDHFTVELRDEEKFWLAKFSVVLTVTVKKGELPDGKTFRRVSKGVLDQSQPSLGGDGVRLPQFPSLSMSGPSEFSKMGERLSDSPDLFFSGVVSFGLRKDRKVPVGMYLCFLDKKKSCVAGKAEVEIIVKEGN